MTRSIRRPGYPWPGQFGLGPQSVDEIVRRMNARPLGDAPRTQLGIRWVSPITDAQFETLKDDSVVGPSEENRLFIAQENRLSGDDVNGYCPSFWVRWAESDTESDNQAKYELDIEQQPFKVYMPQYAWMRNSNAALQASYLKVINRILSVHGGSSGSGWGLRSHARIPVFFNPRTGNWECVALTETLPSHIIGRPVRTILPAETDAGTGVMTFGADYVNVLVNKDTAYTVPTIAPSSPTGITAEYQDPSPSVAASFLVFNWTDVPLEKDIPHVFWLDASSGFYLVDKQLDMVQAVVYNDIEHDASGRCDLDDSSGVSLLSVYNPREKLWSGAKVTIIWCKTKSRYQVVQAWSATKIHATVSSTANANSTGSVSMASVVPLNGHYVPPANPVIYMPPGTMNAVSGETVICDLAWTGTASRWQVTSVLRP